MIFEGTKKSIFFGLGLTRAGMAMPTVDNLIILATIFGVTVDDIIAVNICSTVGISA